jgi:hypothetical protein
MAEIIWEAFKERLGSSKFIEIHFDLDAILQPVENLDDLHDPFLVEEIDNVVLNQPSGKSPSTDGFNIDFMKKCWRTIAADFYELSSGFHDENICIQSLNDSYIVIIPKTENPISISDNKPISLLNSSIKLITKVLANKIQRLF